MTSIEVWQRDHLTTPGVPTKVADLTEVSRREFRVAKNDYGVAQVTVQRSDPEVDELQPGRLLVFNRDSVLYAFLIERRGIVTVSEAEEAGEVVELTCPGVLKVLDDGVCQPQSPALWNPWDKQRRWDWTNPDLSVTAWTTPVELWQQSTVGDPATTSSERSEIAQDQGRTPDTMPDGFVDGSAWWIWSSGLQGSAGTAGSGTYHMPEGTSYFHATFTSGAVRARVLLGADNGCEVAIDGVSIIETGSPPEEAWSRTRRADLELSAGTHTIRVRVWNADVAFTAGNLAGLVLSVHEVDPVTDVPGDVLLRTDDAWKALDYPDPAPGFTPGAILLTLLAEMQALGFLADVDPTFTASLDSDGTTWDEVDDVVTTLGQSFGDVLVMLAESHIDFRINADLTLDAWRKGEHGTATAVEYEAGVNIASLEFDGDSLPVSSLLVAHRDGVETIGDDSWGRQEYVDLSSLPRGQALAQANDMLADLDERWSVALTVEPAGGDVPLDDVEVLDTATVPNPLGSTSVVECIAITWAEDEAGNEILTPEFGDVVLTIEERRKRLLSRASQGAAGGRVLTPPSGGLVAHSPTGPGGGVLPTLSPTRSVVFERDPDVTDTESWPWPADVSGVIYEVAIQLDSVEASSFDVDITINGVIADTVTMPAGKTTWAPGGLAIPVTKNQDVVTIGCADTGFYLQVTVRVS